MIWLIDIDNTCADARRRYRKAGPPPKDSTKSGKAIGRWLKKLQCPEDLARDPEVAGVRNILLGLNAINRLQERGELGGRPQHIFYVTGRDERYRESTQAWLDAHGFTKAPLLMRAKGQDGATGPVKVAHVKTIKQMYPGELITAIDDDWDDTILKALAAEGVFCLKVLPETIP